MASGLQQILSHPLTRGLDLDDPATTAIRKTIIKEKIFLKRIYEEWYTTVGELLPDIEGQVLEIGAGAGFAKECIPGLICSDIIPVTNHDLVCDALHLPVYDDVLRAIIMFNVFHHIPEPETFLSEAHRTIKPGGAIIMIEPWLSPWSKLIYTRLHHEPFEPDVPEWKLPNSGPLTGGNDALPWIVFHRDKKKLEANNEWIVEQIKEYMPFRYLLSGGISMRSFLPGWTFSPLTALESMLPARLNRQLAMFAVVVLRKK